MSRLKTARRTNPIPAIIIIANSDLTKVVKRKRIGIAKMEDTNKYLLLDIDKLLKLSVKFWSLFGLYFPEFKKIIFNENHFLIFCID